MYQINISSTRPVEAPPEQGWIIQVRDLPPSMQFRRLELRGTRDFALECAQIHVEAGHSVALYHEASPWNDPVWRSAEASDERIEGLENAIAQAREWFDAGRISQAELTDLVNTYTRRLARAKGLL
jgi:hypothetical protein